MQETAARLIEWLRDTAIDAGATGFVVGLSGGIDSAVTVALAQRAFPDNTLGVIMPCFSIPEDARDARLLTEALDIPAVTIRLDAALLAMIQELTGETSYDRKNNDLTMANIKPRLRMTALYFYAARRKALVLGTLNRCELLVGYYTKYGDGGVDLLPLANLLKREVRELAEYLGVPQPIIDKQPSAGLWEGHNDEVEMGISYQDIDCYLLSGDSDERVRRTVEALAEKHKHKRAMPLTPPGE